MITVNITFEVITPESAEHGDAEERGFVEENKEFTTKKEAFDYFSVKYGAYYKGNDTDYYTLDPEKCYETGSETYYGLHFSK